MHWHPDFEIATCKDNTLDFQVGQEHIILYSGDSIFINRNILHSIRQVSGCVPDSMPNIVFSGRIIAPETDDVYKKYIHPIADCHSLPFVVFSAQNTCCKEINDLIKNIYLSFEKHVPCYELAVQRNLSRIFEFIFCSFSELPRHDATKVQLKNQIRIQKMLSFIYEHYEESVNLKNIADAANISRSEAGRCFAAYMGCTPVDALIQYRLQMAHKLLDDRSMSIQEISYACGFNTVSYFSRKFKEKYGEAPGMYRKTGK